MDMWTRILLSNKEEWTTDILNCFPGSSVVKNLPANAGDTGESLGREDSLEKAMATHSSILAWEIPWTEEPGGLYRSLWGHKTVGHNLSTKQLTYTTAWMHPKITVLSSRSSTKNSAFVWFQLYKILEYANECRDRKQISGYGNEWEGWGGIEGGITKGRRKLWGRWIHCHDYVDDFTGMYMWKLIKQYTLNRCGLSCINYTSVFSQVP